MKSIVLLSGGMDSCVTLANAVDEYGAENVVAASVSYGQIHSREQNCAEKIAEHFGVKLIKQDISSFFECAKSVSSLLQGSDIEISDKAYVDQIEEEGKPATEVPLRNGAFMIQAAVIAMSTFPDEDVAICIGAHADDAAGNAYPDCTPEFAAAMDEAIRIGSRDHLHVERPLIHLTKAGVVALGLQLKAPFNLTTSCYRGGDKACNHCGTCLDRVNAFKGNGVIDPIEYAVPVDWTGCKKIDYLADKYPEE